MKPFSAIVSPRHSRRAIFKSFPGTREGWKIKENRRINQIDRFRTVPLTAIPLLRGN